WTTGNSEHCSDGGIALHGFSSSVGGAARPGCFSVVNACVLLARMEQWRQLRTLGLVQRQMGRAKFGKSNRTTKGRGSSIHSARNRRGRCRLGSPASGNA